MKKILASIMVFLLVFTSLTSCGYKQNTPVVPNDGATSDGIMPQTNVNAQADTSKFIGEEKAKELALKRAEIAAEGVKFDRVELDYDDGIWQYEVDFTHGNTEYDVDINAETGEILSFETENKAG
jgi:uncharacterized membrane protein YkoI